MRSFSDVNGNKRYEDDEGNPIELHGVEKEIAELSNAGGDVDVNDVLDILKANK